MSQRARLRILVSLTVALLLGAVILDTWWLIPELHRLRNTIDTDRAATEVIIQQQSNIDQLTKDVESIQSKQSDLDGQSWTFLNEDAFYTTFEDLAKAANVTIDSPIIADATPTDTILVRAMTITIRGSFEQSLDAVNAIQSIRPLIAIQKLEVTPSQELSTTQVTVTAITSWR